MDKTIPSGDVAAFKREYERKKEAHKRSMQESTAELVEQFKKAGVIKPCSNCGEDRWSGTVLSISGFKPEDQYRERGVMGAIMGASGAFGADTILTCLSLTCGNCSSIQFFNMEPIMVAFGATLASEDSAKSESAGTTKQGEPDAQ